MNTILMFLQSTLPIVLAPSHVYIRFCLHTYISNQGRLTWMSEQLNDYSSFKKTRICDAKYTHLGIQNMLISKRAVLTTILATFLGILSQSSESALAMLLAFLCLCLDLSFCRTVSTQNLSMQILHDMNEDIVGVLAGKNDLLHRKAI